MALAAAVTVAGSQEHLTCAWPDGFGKLSVVEFLVTKSSLEFVPEPNDALAFKSPWHLDFIDPHTLVATATITTMNGATPLAFVSNIVLNRSTGDMVMTSTKVVGSRPEVLSVRGNCRARSSR